MLSSFCTGALITLISDTSATYEIAPLWSCKHIALAYQLVITIFNRNGTNSQILCEGTF